MPAESPLRDGDRAGLGLIETLRWEPGAGFLRLERHLARLAASSEALGLPCDLDAVTRALRPVGAETPLRIRLHLDATGTPTVTSQPFAPLPESTVWRLAVATTRLSSADPLLRHKTTRRATYDAARAEFPAADADEVLLLNERGELCEGTITSLFVDRDDGGPLVTPPLACGLLAGVLRQVLIDEGRAVETVLRPRDLEAAKAILVGNSLRGPIPAMLARPH